MSFQNQRKVPFWIPAAETDSLDELLTTEMSGAPAATGLLGLDRNHLHIQWSLRPAGSSQRFWQMLTGSGERPPPESRRVVAELAIPLADLADAQIKGRWNRTIRLATNDLGHFADIPGARGHELTLKVARRHREAAERLVLDLQMWLSELGLAHLDGEIARLEDGGDG